MAELIMTEESSTPSTPSSGKWKIYPKADGYHVLDDAGLDIGPLGPLSDYIITPSVASNNLTVAIKNIAAADASSSKPLVFRVGNTIYQLAAATSFTKNAGTNWCNAGGVETAAQPIDFFVYAIGETGASAGLKFGFSRLPYARTMGDFVNTNTSEKYIAGSWTNFNSTDPVTNIGRFRAQLSASASFNWSIASAAVVNRLVENTDVLNFIPALTNATLGNGTLSGKYFVENRLLYAKIAFTLGSTSAISGDAQFTIPFSLAEATAFPFGLANILDSGTAVFSGSPLYISAGKVAIRIMTASGTYVGQAFLSATVPMTWTTSDNITFWLVGVIE